MIKDLLRIVLMGMPERQVRIGINYGMDHSTAHGILHVVSEHGTVEHVNFTADKPRYLKRPTASIIGGIFEQAQKLGLHPKHVELRTGALRRVFTVDQVEPIFVQRLS